MTQPPPDGARTICSENGTLDVSVFRGGREYTLLGPAGPQREHAFIPELSADDVDILPVLIGAGVGYGLSLFLERLDALPAPPGKTRPPLIVLDTEIDILEAAAIRTRFTPERVLIISERDPDTALKLLTKVQAERDYPPLKVAINPFYPRINRAYYDHLRDACLAGEKGLIRQQAQRRRFSGDKPRILLLTSKYFLMGEILAACERLDLITVFCGCRTASTAKTNLSKTCCVPCWSFPQTLSLRSTTSESTVKACSRSCWKNSACPWPRGSWTTLTWSFTYIIRW